MKNMLFATALAASAFLALPAAHAADNSGFFINGNIGQSSFDKRGYLELCCAGSLCSRCW